MMAYVWALLIYWLVYFVACYFVLEKTQDLLYDEVTPHSGLKVAGGTLLLAALAARFQSSFLTMFTSDIGWTVLQAIVWFLVFTFVFQFHPPHALGLSLVTMVLVSGLASLGVESLMKPSRTVSPAQARPTSEPRRGSLNALPKAATEK
jgi:hypothetical protein